MGGLRQRSSDSTTFGAMYGDDVRRYRSNVTSLRTNYRERGAECDDRERGAECAAGHVGHVTPLTCCMRVRSTSRGCRWLREHAHSAARWERGTPGAACWQKYRSARRWQRCLQMRCPAGKR